MQVVAVAAPIQNNHMGVVVVLAAEVAAAVALIPNNSGVQAVIAAVVAAVVTIPNNSSVQAVVAAVVAAAVALIPNNSGVQAVVAAIVAAVVTIPNNSGVQEAVAAIVAAVVTIPNNSGLQAAAEAVTAVAVIQSSHGQVHLNRLVEDHMSIQALMEVMAIDHTGVLVLDIVTVDPATATDQEGMEQILERDSMTEWVLMEERGFQRKCLDWG